MEWTLQMMQCWSVVNPTHRMSAMFSWMMKLVSELRPAYGMMILVFKVNARRVGNWATPDSAWNDRWQTSLMPQIRLRGTVMSRNFWLLFYWMEFVSAEEILTWSGAGMEQSLIGCKSRYLIRSLRWAINATTALIQSTARWLERVTYAMNVLQVARAESSSRWCRDHMSLVCKRWCWSADTSQMIRWVWLMRSKWFNSESSWLGWSWCASESVHLTRDEQVFWMLEPKMQWLYGKSWWVGGDILEESTRVSMSCVAVSNLLGDCSMVFPRMWWVHLG